MAISNISSLPSFDINRLNSISPSQPTSNTTPAVNTAASTQSAPILRGEDTSMLNASFMRSQLNAMLTSRPTSSISNSSASANATTINPSLKPRPAFQQPVNTFLNNTLNLPTNKIVGQRANLTVNSANILQNSQLTLKGGGSATAFYTGGFPPTSTATLPRLAFDPQGVVSFYRNAGNLNNTQLTSVQNLYAGDLTSRKNYSTNLANLARNLTSLSSAGVDKQAQKTINSALNTLKQGYNSLSDVNAPAPNPRALYAQIANAYKALSNDCQLSTSQKALVTNGLNILAIGASNYDTNRVPVAGTLGTPAPTTPPTAAQATAAGFPLPAFDTARKTPLSTAQAMPAQVFGTQVSSYLKSVGLNTDPQKLNYQVNSADKLQNIIVPLGRGGTMTVFFNTGFPVPAGTAPQVAFNSTVGARRYLDVAQNQPATQQQLTTYYANPANATRRTNYNTNLTNLTAGFQQLQSARLSSGNQKAVQDSLSTLQAAQSQLASGGLPDILSVYQQLGDNLDKITSRQGGLNAQQRDALNTLNGSLLPVGVQNYYLTPVILSQPS